MGNRIICIGRQFGSGGHEIAVRLAERLGIKVYEKDLVHLACQYGELAVKTLEDADEKATNPYLFQTVHEGNYHVTRGLPTSEVLFKLQSHEIRRIARREPCIFVGRCADHVLEGTDAQLLRVFVCAPFEDRIRRKMEQEDLSRLRAKNRIRKMDRQRKTYYEHYTGRCWGDPEHCDLLINTGEVSMEQAVEQIAARYSAL
ncbi:MAG: cytidylate kinase-like family protein [Oscillospiraceae bacterium]|nr:cytidylate kinase-like family protein [Oscillospiraceae bacterium]